MKSMFNVIRKAYEGMISVEGMSSHPNDIHHKKQKPTHARKRKGNLPGKAGRRGAANRLNQEEKCGESLHMDQAHGKQMVDQPESMAFADQMPADGVMPCNFGDQMYANEPSTGPLDQALGDQMLPDLDDQMVSGQITGEGMPSEESFQCNDARKNIQNKKKKKNKAHHIDEHLGNTADCLDTEDVDTGFETKHYEGNHCEANDLETKEHDRNHDGIPSPLASPQKMQHPRCDDESYEAPRANRMAGRKRDLSVRSEFENFGTPISTPTCNLRFVYDRTPISAKHAMQAGLTFDSPLSCAHHHQRGRNIMVLPRTPERDILQESLATRANWPRLWQPMPKFESAAIMSKFESNSKKRSRSETALREFQQDSMDAHAFQRRGHVCENNIVGPMPLQKASFMQPQPSTDMSTTDSSSSDASTGSPGAPEGTNIYHQKQTRDRLTEEEMIPHVAVAEEQPPAERVYAEHEQWISYDPNYVAMYPYGLQMPHPIPLGMPNAMQNATMPNHPMPNAGIPAPAMPIQQATIANGMTPLQPTSSTNGMAQLQSNGMQTMPPVQTACHADNGIMQPTNSMQNFQGIPAQIVQPSPLPSIENRFHQHQQWQDPKKYNNFQGYYHCAHEIKPLSYHPNGANPEQVHAHQAPHQVSHRAPHQASHQASHQLAHQPVHQGAHQTSHQAAHQNVGNNMQRNDARNASNYYAGNGCTMPVVNQKNHATEKARNLAKTVVKQQWKPTERRRRPLSANSRRPIRTEFCVLAPAYAKRGAVLRNFAPQKGGKHTDLKMPVNANAYRQEQRLRQAPRMLTKLISKNEEESIPSLRTLPPESISHHHTEGIGLSARVSRAERADLGGGSSDSSTRSGKKEEVADMVEQKVEPPALEKAAVMPSVSASSAFTLVLDGNLAGSNEKHATAKTFVEAQGHVPKPNMESEMKSTQPPPAMQTISIVQVQPVPSRTVAATVPSTVGAGLNEILPPPPSYQPPSKQSSMEAANSVADIGATKVNSGNQQPVANNAISTDTFSILTGDHLLVPSSESGALEESNANPEISFLHRNDSTHVGGDNDLRKMSSKECIASAPKDPPQNYATMARVRTPTNLPETATPKAMDQTNNVAVPERQFPKEFPASHDKRLANTDDQLKVDVTPKPANSILEHQISPMPEVKSFENQQIISPDTSQYDNVCTPMVSRNSHNMQMNSWDAIDKEISGGRGANDNVDIVNSGGRDARKSTTRVQTPNTGLCAANDKSQTAHLSTVLQQGCYKVDLEMCKKNLTNDGLRFAGSDDIASVGGNGNGNNKPENVSSGNGNCASFGGHLIFPTPQMIQAAAQHTAEHTPIVCNKANTGVNHANNVNNNNNVNGQAPPHGPVPTPSGNTFFKLPEDLAEPANIDLCRLSDRDLASFETNTLLKVLLHYIRVNVDHQKIRLCFDLYFGKLYDPAASVSPTHRIKMFEFLLQVCAECRQLKLAEYFYRKVTKREGDRSEYGSQLMSTMMQLYANSQMYSRACELFFNNRTAKEEKKNNGLNNSIVNGFISQSVAQRNIAHRSPMENHGQSKNEMHAAKGRQSIHGLQVDVDRNQLQQHVASNGYSNENVRNFQNRNESLPTCGKKVGKFAPRPAANSLPTGSPSDAPHNSHQANSSMNGIYGTGDTTLGNHNANLSTPVNNLNGAYQNADVTIGNADGNAMNTMGNMSSASGASLGCVLKCCIELGHYEAAEALFQSSKPEFPDCMYMIRGFAKQGKLQEARKVVSLIRKREQKNINMIRPVYNALLDSVVSSATNGRLSDVSEESVDQMDNHHENGNSNNNRANTKKIRALAKEILVEMEHLDLCDSVTYNTYLKGFCQNLEDAFACLEELRSKRLFTPDRVSYNSILNLAVTVGDTKRAWEIVHGGLLGQKYVIDHYTVTIMLKTVKHQATNHTNPTIAKNNKLAFELLDKIWIGQDEFLLKTAIDSCIRGKEYKRLRRILEGNEIKFPNVPTYGSLIKGWGILRNVERIFTLWSEMVDHCGLQADEITLGCMIDACVSNGRGHDALQLFNSYKEVIRPNAIMYSTLLKGFALERRANDALKFVKDNNVTMNEVSYNTLIDACCRSSVNMMSEAESLLEEMVAKKLKLDIITFGTLIKGYMSHGLVDHAILIYRKHFCEANVGCRLVPNEVIFNTLLDGCVKNNRLEKALDLFHQIFTLTKNFRPSHFTLTIAIKMYGRLGKVQKALDLVQIWPKQYHIQLNNHVFTCLLSALLNNRWYIEALMIPSQMKQARIKPDARTYGTLVSGLLKAGDVEHGCEILVTAFTDGPGVEYETFLRVCRHFPHMYQQCRERAWHPDAKSVLSRAMGALSNFTHSSSSYNGNNSHSSEHNGGLSNAHSSHSGHANGRHRK